MTLVRQASRYTARALLLLSLARGAVLAQIPRGLIVTAHSRAPGVGATTGGVYLHHPAGNGSAPLPGLGADLTGATAAPGDWIGANCVAIAEPEGSRLYVGEAASDLAPPGLDTIDLHEIQIIDDPFLGLQTTDTIVATLVAGPPSVPTPGHIGARQISGIAVIPGAGEAILSLAGFTIGMPPTPLARFTPAGGGPGQITPISVFGLIGSMPNAVALSPDGTTIYLTVFESFPTYSLGYIFSIPIGGGVATLIATIPAGSGPSSMTVDRRTGLLYIGCLQGPPNLFVVDPVTYAMTTMTTSIGTINGLALEEATGALVAVGGSGGIPVASIHRIENGPSNNGFASIIATPNWPGWGIPTGVAIHTSVETRCPATPGLTFAADWRFPWYGAWSALSSLPLAGNGSFGLTIQTTPPTPLLAVFFGVSLYELSPPLPFYNGFLCVDVLDPAYSGVLAFTALPPWATELSLPAPLPPAAANLRFLLQAVAADNLSIAFTSTVAIHCLN